MQEQQPLPLLLLLQWECMYHAQDPTAAKCSDAGIEYAFSCVLAA
jgi:hypothetical protein